MALSVAAAVGLVVLAAAHQRAGDAMDEALRSDDRARRSHHRRRGWHARSVGAMVMAGLAVVGLVRARELNVSPAWSTRASLGGVSSSTCTGRRDVGTIALCSSRSTGAAGSRGTAASKRDH